MATIRTLVYEIFVDRFAGPNGESLPPLPELGGGLAPWLHHAGGSLDGIVRRLDHVIALGADALYLTPVCRAPTNHKYDAWSFDEVDPAFGGDAAFARLADACKARGLGLVFDGVFNHVGTGHPWFVEASADLAGPRARSFRFGASAAEYARWQGHHHLPELDLDREEVLAELFDGERSFLRRWIERGVTGFRLDCANDLGLSVCARIAASARRAGAIDATVGEVMAFGDRWVREGGLDGVMNYWLYETAHGLARGEVSAEDAARNLAIQAERFPRDALLRSWNMLASHDTPRLATEVPDAKARALAWVLAFVSPGTPLVYYGEEIGMTGGPDPGNRAPMSWDESTWDRATLELVKTLAKLRAARRSLKEGDHLAIPISSASPILAFARTTDDPEDVVIVVANASPRPAARRLFVPWAHLLDSLTFADLLDGHAPVKASKGRLDVALEPWQVALFAPKDGTIPGYRFLRRR